MSATSIQFAGERLSQVERGSRGGSAFGAHLRRFRTEAGLSQEALAERAGLTPNAIGSLERGERRRPYPHTIRALSDALDLTDEQRTTLTAAAHPNDLVETTPPAAEPTPAGRPEPLPVPPTQLIGRAQAVENAIGLLGWPNVRLATLTGIGGVGKTRLAIEIARSVSDQYPGGVAFIALAPISDPSLLIPSIARGIGLQETRSDLVRDQVTAHLRDRAMLLVLDNLEHLLPDAAREIADVLAGTEAPAFLVTSRRPLQIRGEVEVPVEPLGLEAETGDAIELFEARARDVNPAFAVTTDNAGTIARICRQLGGLPLAIELAAAWIRSLSPDVLLARLDQVLGVDGARDLPTRQRTMRATLDWSHSLLSGEDQVLFRRLAVFSGGFTLEAAEAICPDPQHPTGDVLGSVSRLVEHSLIRMQPGGEPVRYGMLEPVRQYAGEHLAASGEGAPVRARHADYYLELAERAEAGLVGPDQAYWLARFDAEHPNLRGALRWLTDQSDFELVIELLWRVQQFYVTRGHFNEGAGWLELPLGRDEQLSDIARIRLRYTLAYLIVGQDRLTEAVALCEEGAEIADRSGYDHLGAMCRGMASGLGVYLGDLSMTRHHAEAVHAWFEHNPIEWWVIGAHFVTAADAWGRGEVEAAVQTLETAADQMRRAGFWWHLMHVLNFHTQIAVTQRDPLTAARTCRETISLARRIGVTLALPDTLVMLGMALAQIEQPALAARMFGAVEAMRERLGDTMIVASRRDVYDQHIARITVELGADAMAEAWQAGRGAPLDNVIEESLVVFPPPNGSSDNETGAT